MNKMQAQVEEFHKAFGLSVGTGQTAKDVKLRLKLIHEELSESYDALYDVGNMANLVPLVDLYCDLLYFIFGGAVAIGVDLEPFFDAIHQANMNKLWDGQPRYRNDGKVIKPPDWEPADLDELWEDLYGTV